jgi:hypothetical protein
MALSNDDIKRIVEDSFLKADFEFEYPPVCLEIAGQYGNQIFATLGNFSTILAPPKVGKTTLTGVIVSALLSGKQISNFIPILNENKRVIVWVDTEQGKPECVKTIQSISTQITGNKKEHPENLKFSSLRKHGKTVRLEALEYIIYNTPNIGFLVIDGIRDLVSSINDEKEATLIADKLLKWSQELNIHIMGILHENKGDKNARGHVGTELMNKAETVATLSRGENSGIRTTIIEPKFTRHKEFEPFAFTIDNGIVIQSEIKKEYEPKNPQVQQLTRDEIVDTLKASFVKDNKLTYKNCWEGLQTNLFGTHKIEFGIEKSKKLLTWLKENNYLIYDEQTKHYSPNIPN